MKNILIVLSLFLVSCNYKNYNCDVVHHTGIGAGIEVTTHRKFKGTPAQKEAFEEKNTIEGEKTTTCY